MGGGKVRSSSRKKLTSNGSKPESLPKSKMTGKPEKRKCRRMLSAILTRVLFALHAGIALWRVSFDWPKEYLYFLSIGLGCLVIEMVFALVVRKGKEYKWFCPSVLFYLMSVVPCLWLLKLSDLNGLAIGNVTVTSPNASLPLRNVTNPMGPSVSSLNRTRRDIELLQLKESEQFISRLRRDIADGDVSERKNKRRRRKKNKTRQNANGSQDPDESVNGTDSAILPNPQISANEPVTPLDDQDSQTSQNTNRRNMTSPAAFLSSRVMSQTLNTSPITSIRSSPPSKTATAHTFFDVTTSSSKDVTSVIPGDDVIRLDNLGEKIKDGFSNIEKETANLLNKTKAAIEQQIRDVSRDEWILLLHQVLLFVLVIGRWLLPKGEITRDQLSQLLLVFIGVGADILEFVTETIDGDELDPSEYHDTTPWERHRSTMILHYVIYGVWSWSLLQFTLVLTASKSRKTRVGFDAEFVVDTSKKGCCGNSIFASADLWGILVTLFLQDVPFLATRLYILIVYNIRHQMMIFFTGKNALVVILQIYRIVILQLSRKRAKNDAVDESEVEPLRGTLTQLAKRATMIAGEGARAGDDIRDATFKRERDGSVVVKIHLENEETLRKKRKKSSTKSNT